MAIVKFKKREELKILFAIKLPPIIFELYKEVRSKKTANEIIRNYDNIMEEKELLKYNMEIEDIDFRILEFDFNGKMEIEEMIMHVKRLYNK